MNNNIVLLLLIILTTVFISCSKDDNVSNIESFIVSSSQSVEDELDGDQIEVNINGGFDTLYIHSSKTFHSVFETKEVDDWIKIISVDQVSVGIQRLIIEVLPVEQTFKIRTGVLSFTTDDLDGKFVSVSQGYVSRFLDDFNWLRYGVLNPLDAGRESLMKDWTVTQTMNGWTSTIVEGQEYSHVYGRFEHVKIGSEFVGADLLSRNIGGIERDSLLVLSFNAVAYASDFEANDSNTLRVELENGCTFMDGSTSQILTLGYYDAQSALVSSKFWDDSFQSLYIKKPENNTVISTIRVRFTSGDNLLKAKNRVFMDNFSIYSVKEYAVEKR